MSNKIAFQGELGAFSHQACKQEFPDMEILPCQTFEDALGAIRDGTAQLGMIPIENSLYGRVADIHQLLPESGLYIIGETFLRIRMQLIGLPGTKLEEIKTAQSHTVALGQCRQFLHQHAIMPSVGADTAGSVRQIRDGGDKSVAAIASELAAEEYEMEIIAKNIEDAAHNTTRFLYMSPKKVEADPREGNALTSFVFRVRNVPAALYKTMGGFATNGINMIKLESYMVEGSFTATQFYAEIEGHPEEDAVANAMEELGFYTDYLKVLGVYPRHSFRG